MATTDDGVEFFLLEVTGEEPVGLGVLQSQLGQAVRAGDAILQVGDHLYVAFAGPEEEADRGGRRIARKLKERGYPVAVRLLTEPFPAELEAAAERVIRGEVRTQRRGGRQETAVSWD